MTVSLITPLLNAASTLPATLDSVARQNMPCEHIIVDGGSTDDTAAIASKAGATVISHPESMGNRASIKSGARAASGDMIAFMDGDGQHDAGELGPLIETLSNGYDMAIGARDTGSHASVGRLFANGLYNRIATIMSGRKILDLTSGFRVAKADKFKQFLYLLPNGFSYPTTITMAFLRSGYPIRFEPITAAKRIGKSHIQPLKDGVRFLIIIFKIATLYSPLKIFLPASGLFFLTGIGYYAYTFMTAGRFTNMSMLLFSASVIIFLIGLISEQITALTYSKT